MVILEAMAAKVPFLATDVGNIKDLVDKSGGGIIIPGTKSLCVRDCLVSFMKIAIKKLLYNDLGPWSGNYNFTKAEISTGANLLTELAKDQRKCKETGKRGYDYWFRHATWDMVARQYESLYKDLLC
jgi:glycosyltransferase involved in cell wall biosynthesis